MLSWVESIKQICPDYDELVDYMEQGSIVKPCLEKKGRRWVLRIDEIVPDSVKYRYSDLNNLDKRVDWTLNQLKDWPDCIRTSWDMWSFKKKDDAEKFITLYYLKWEK